MGRKKRIEFENACHHVTHRGNLRDNIFFDNQDRIKFLEFLKDSVNRYKVILHAFVMMDNHYHFLIQTPYANLGQFMQQFNVRYTSWVNWKYRRSGHLFQGPYKAKLVDADSYLTAVSRYIHLNPVKVKKRESWSKEQKFQFLKMYSWSSLPGFLDEFEKLNFVNYDLVLSDYNGSRKKYAESIIYNIGDDKESSLISKFVNVIGNKAFIEKYSKNDLKVFKYKEYDKSLVESKVSVNLNIPLDKLKTTKGTKRQILIYFLHKFTKLNQIEIADYLNLSLSTISVSGNRLKKTLEKKQDLREIFNKIEKQLNK